MYFTGMLELKEEGSSVQSSLHFLFDTEITSADLFLLKN